MIQVKFMKKVMKINNKLFKIYLHLSENLQKYFAKCIRIQINVLKNILTS